MKKDRILIVLAFCWVLTSCQSIKEGLSGSKSDNSDEFLVQKKNPLVLPPKYLKLPTPQETEFEIEEESLNQDRFDIQKMLGIEEETAITSPDNGNVEEFVLRNIKDN